jgi:hypothetical protein
MGEYLTKWFNIQGKNEAGFFYRIKKIGTARPGTAGAPRAVALRSGD